MRFAAARKALVYFSYLSSLRERGGAGQTQILMYHKVSEKPSLNPWGTIPFAVFEQQIQYLLKQHYSLLSLDEFLDAILQGCLPKKNSILLTFDDGAQDNYHQAFPVLKKYGLTATFFLATSYVGQSRSFWWDELEQLLLKTSRSKLNLCAGLQDIALKNWEDKINAFALLERHCKRSGVDPQDFLKDLSRFLEVELNDTCSCMDWEEVRQMHQQGMSFGAHTVNHVNLAQVSPQTAYQEIYNSKTMLEQQLSKRVRVFAYPFGKKNQFLPEHKTILAQTGFEAAFSSEEGRVTAGDDVLELKRVAVSGIEDLSMFRARLSTNYPQLVNRIKRLTGHEAAL